MQEINITLFQFLNNFSAYSFIAKISPFLADFPIFFLPLFLSGMWLYFAYTNTNNSKKSELLNIFYCVVVAIFISLIIQQFVDIERPETAIVGAGRLLLNHLPDASFPSDHASVSFAFLTALFLTGYKKVFWSFIPWVILMNLSRVIAGVHWPFDILVWAIVWILWAIITLKYLIGNKVVKNINLFIIKTLSYIKL